MRRMAAVAALALAFSITTAVRAGADPLLLATVDSFIHQFTGCDGPCLTNGLQGYGTIEILIDSTSHGIIAASPVLGTLAGLAPAPRLVAFNGSAFPGEDCTGEGGPLCYSFNSNTLTQLSNGWTRDIVVQTYADADPYYGLLPSAFELQEQGVVDGRDAWFVGWGSVRSIQAVNSSLNPIPEPGTLALLGAGVAGLLLRRRDTQDRVERS